MYTPWVALSMLLVAAIPGLPYGYYQLLRLFICGMACYGIILAHMRNQKHTRNIFIVIAVLFNPFLPVHLSREIWLPIDIVSGIYFAVSYRLFGTPYRT